MTDHTLLALAAILTLPLDLLAAASLVRAIRGPYEDIRLYDRAARRGGRWRGTEEEAIRRIGPILAAQREG